MSYFLLEVELAEMSGRLKFHALSPIITVVFVVSAEGMDFLLFCYCMAIFATIKTELYEYVTVVRH